MLPGGVNGNIKRRMMMFKLHSIRNFRVEFFALLMILSLVGCDNDTTIREPAYPNQQQIGEAMEELMESGKGELPAALGPSLAEILDRKAPEGSEDMFLEPREPGFQEFICGSRGCVCAEHEDIPDHLKDKWSCTGMGVACLAKGYVPVFPCSVTGMGMMICRCAPPAGNVK